MKKLVQLLAITAFVATFSQPLFAEEKNTSTAANTTTTTSASTETNTGKPKGLSMSNLLQQLQKAGYIVKNAEYNKDDNQYKVEVVDRRGEKQNLEVNASTGLAPDQKKVPNEVSMTQAVKKVEKNGAYVVSVSTDSNNYKVVLMDNKGKEQDLVINIETGKVSS